MRSLVPLAAALALALAAAVGVTACDTPAKAEACDNQADDDGDGKADCADPDCERNVLCRNRFETCDNGADDDGDGKADCADPDCSGSPACVPVESCDNGQDDDGDGETDCEDPDCDAVPLCLVEDCANRTDDDGDGLTDCADVPDCVTLPCNAEGYSCDVSGDCSCVPSGLESCHDRKDNDCNGQVDCDDAPCRGEVGCREDCGNGQDDNGNFRVDCKDVASCPSGSVCGPYERRCDDFQSCVCPGGRVEDCMAGAAPSDEDCDGLADCADPDCWGNPCALHGRTCQGGACVCPGGEAAEATCNDGRDNDCDGLADCADPDCLNDACGDHGLTCLSTSPAGCLCPGGYPPESSTASGCDDGADNDCDGAVDCQDTDCAAACQPTKYDNGAECSSGPQCKSGDCDLKQPGGFCRETCTTSGLACTHGGRCVVPAGQTTGVCRPTCGSPSGCRDGYGCFNYGWQTTLGAWLLVCDARCRGNGDCAANPTGYQTCNLYTGLCEATTTGGAEGAGCTLDSDCRSGFCLSEPDFGYAQGYCAAKCAVSNGVCPAGDACADVRERTASGAIVPGDDTGLCVKACTSTANCRAGYGCFLVTLEGNQATKTGCAPRCSQDAQCTGGRRCNRELGVCAPSFGKNPTGGPCATGADCESRICQPQFNNATGDHWIHGYCWTSCIRSQGDGTCPPDPGGRANHCIEDGYTLDDRGMCVRTCGNTGTATPQPALCRDLANPATAPGYVCADLCNGGRCWSCWSN